MGTFLVTFLIISLVMAGLALGVMMGRKPIGGSCGGLGKLGLECEAGCEKPCPRREARMREAAEEARHNAG